MSGLLLLSEESILEAAIRNFPLHLIGQKLLIVVVQSICHVQLFATPWTAACLLCPVLHYLLKFAQTHEVGYLVKIKLLGNLGSVFFTWIPQCPVQTSVTMGKKAVDTEVQQILQQKSQVLWAKQCARPVFLTFNSEFPGEMVKCRC